MRKLIPFLIVALPCAGLAQAPAASSTNTTQSRLTARVMQRDVDGDGKVSKAEFVAGAGSGKATAKRDPAETFGRLDANHDGYLDASEVQAQVARRMARLDSDGDGKVTGAERSAMRRPAAAGTQ